MREFFNENFAERLVILLKCPKELDVTGCPSVGGMLVKSW